MHLRPYVPADAEPTLDVFRRAIRETAARDYSPEQIAAWSSDDSDRREWAARRAAADTVVAVDEGRVVAFIDVDGLGYIDMLFVDPAFGGRGIAAALLEVVTEAASTAGAESLTTHASLTARGFFERAGFVVVEEQRPVIRGVELTNFVMRRELGGG
ncbi:acyltransferase [Frondihabitans sucicola]|uniref:Acyltransferase n=1 Tax=Frondihabitans sucicola TaxID=1268041 RepID=A0ABM8GIX9_9MICO|nr:GNAT family N-acetyltransferase [Frondihabitans sucicola]BDZ48345.1 acyltransferase [Frondihabitans sucicola]